jgi:CheY-like chemotaxis protein
LHQSAIPQNLKPTLILPQAVNLCLLYFFYQEHPYRAMNLIFSGTSIHLNQAMSHPKQSRLLVVDDEPAIRLTMRSMLESCGFDVETASSAKEAINKLTTSVFDLVITDMRMETETAGSEVILAAEELDYDPALVILSASPLCSSYRHRVQAIFVKGGNVAELLRRVKELLVERENQKAPEKRTIRKA